MPLKGLHLELLRRDSFKFLEYEDLFGADTLVKLYKIHYSGTSKHKLRSSEWSNALYFHGTAHCGCLSSRSQNENEYNEPDEWKDNRKTEDRTDALNVDKQQVGGVVAVVEEMSVSVVIESPIRIAAWDWCNDAACQTWGILNFGHRRPLIQRGEGHYFSAHSQTAKYFALQKLGQLKTANAGLLYSVFICRVRHVYIASYKYVMNDEDILPCYLAIVRHTEGPVLNPKFEGDASKLV
ncbi:hypothetical protein BGZ96_008553 [Linnemannia gamsii]|uniref:Uncharacterized protein n=1 Tax=Linnemannia gamsii TaxID=64522 RepID=A0ABQ7JY39_9FUNG|nr:hypothetical protein BGZ96_008553 [Linnemannia gamsii]